jgi:signal transduction histidine kinase
MRRRRTLRTRLTLLYAGPFLLSAALLLTIPISQTRSTVPAYGQVNPPDGGAGVVVARGVNTNQVLGASAIGLALAVLVSLVVGWWIAGRFLRPLRTITATARDISASQLHRRLGLAGPDDEFKDLAQTLDALFGRLEASFESQRHFVANASHELRTPMTAERTLLQVALADPDADVESLRSACQDVLALGEQQERLIEALLTLASSEQGIERGEPFDLAEIAAGAVAARRAEAQRRGIRVETALGAASASGDPNLVASLVANLVENALRYNAPGGWSSVATTTADGRARLTITNTGPVIPPDLLEGLFEPFQRLGDERTRRTDGHGLGLAIVRAIANAHGATVLPRARPEGGLTIEIQFPS